MSESETRQRLAAILMADVAGYSRLMSCDERGTVAALDTARAVFRTTIDANRGRVIDMAGDSVLAIFETANGAVASALAVQAELGRRSAEVAADCRMQFRIGVHLGDVIEKSDGTIYGDGVNIAARLEEHRRAGRRHRLRRGPVRDPAAHERDLRRPRRAARQEHRRAGARLSRRAMRRRRAPRTPPPRRDGAGARARRQAVDRRPAVQQHERRPRAGVLRRRHHRGHHHRAVALPRAVRDLAQLVVQVQGQRGRRAAVRARARRAVRRRGQRQEGRQARPHHGAADRRRDRPPRLGRALRPRPGGHLRDPGRGHDVDRRHPAGPGRGGGARSRRPARRPRTWPPTSACSPARSCTTAATARTTRARSSCCSARSSSIRATPTRTPGRPACSARPGSTTGARAGPTTELVIAEALRTAQALDDNDCDVHRILAAINIVQDNHDQAVYHQARALSLNPNDDLVVVQQGEILTWLGQRRRGHRVDQEGDAPQSLPPGALLEPPRRAPASSPGATAKRSMR